MASKRNKFAPRNIGADAAPRSDHMLVLLPPAKEKIPFFDKYKNTDRTKGVAFKTINDPNANKWHNLNTGHHMKTMMAIDGEFVDRGDRGVLVDFYVDFAGEGGDGVVDTRDPWLFWPGGWHAKNGWWDDDGLNYSLEAVVLRDERDSEDALKKEKEAALEEAKITVQEAQRVYDEFTKSEEWKLLSDEDKQHAAQVMLNTHRGVMPKRLHYAIAALQADMGEARRKRLEPKGRNGLSDYSKWHGVKVNSKFRQVSSLALPYHRIKGKLNRAIDEFFVKLRGLAELHLVGNRLSGYISPNINHVRSLRLVLLRNNCLTGKIPESMGELRALVALDVSRNQLTGTIPSTFENLVHLQVLNVGDNLLQGPIQCIDNLTNIHNLRYLNLEGNKFNGYLSCSFSDLVRLRVLSLARNDLSGPVPKSLGSLTELVSIDLSRNRFSGGLPFRPALQPALHQMKFYGNEDLVGPDLWLRSNTLRFKMERDEAERAKKGVRGRAHVIDSRVAAPFREPGEAYSDTIHGRTVVTAADTVKSLRATPATGIWSTTSVPSKVATQSVSHSDALASSTWSEANGDLHLAGTLHDWPMTEMSDEHMLLDELKRLNLAPDETLRGSQSLSQRQQEKHFQRG